MKLQQQKTSALGPCLELYALDRLISTCKAKVTKLIRILRRNIERERITRFSGLAENNNMGPTIRTLP